MGRAYLHSEILKDKADEIKEKLEEFKSQPDFQEAFDLLVDLEKELRLMSTDLRLPEELYNSIAERLNKKRTKEIREAFEVLEDFVESMKEEFDEYWEDKDEPRQFNI